MIDNEGINFNSALRSLALRDNTFGESNSLFGFKALRTDDIVNFNVTVGINSLYHKNTAIGYNTGIAYTGENNV